MHYWYDDPEAAKEKIRDCILHLKGEIEELQNREKAFWAEKERLERIIASDDRDRIDNIAHHWSRYEWFAFD